jgi:hypothetical protein
MTLHLNASNSVTQKILSFLETLKKEGESIEIIDDSLYKFEKDGILKGSKQISNGEFCSAEDLIKELNN